MDTFDKKIVVEILCDSEDVDSLKWFVEDCLDRASCDVILRKYITIEDCEEDR